MILNATTKSIRVVLGEAKTTTDCDVTTSYGDTTGQFFLPGNNETVTNGTTPVTIVSAPPANTQRSVQEITVHNNDTVDHTVILQLLVSATVYIFREETIPVNGTFIYSPDGGAVTTAIQPAILLESGSAGVKISALPAFSLTTPPDGSEKAPIVEAGATTAITSAQLYTLFTNWLNYVATNPLAAPTTTSNGLSIDFEAGTGGSVSGDGGNLALSAGSAQTSGSGGELDIQTGGGKGAAGDGGSLFISTGLGAGSGQGGPISIAAAAGGATGTGGNVNLYGGSGGGTSGDGGAIGLAAGAATTVGNGGGVSIFAGNGGATSGDGGSIVVLAGTTPTSGKGGEIDLTSGAGVGDLGGPVNVSSANMSGSFATGSAFLFSGNIVSGSGQSGDSGVGSGNSDTGTSGTTFIYTGDAAGGTANSGPTQISSGASAGGTTGNVDITTGNAATGNSGNITLNIGTAGSTRGTIVMTGMTDASGGSTGTLKNAPHAADPSIWIKTTVNGTVVAIPAWTV